MCYSSFQHAKLRIFIGIAIDFYILYKIYQIDMLGLVKFRAGKNKKVAPLKGTTLCL